MIKVTKKYYIDVQSLCYCTGKMAYAKDKDGNEIRVLQSRKYFTDFERAVQDVYERVCKDELDAGDMDLEEAIEKINETRKEFIKRVNDIKKSFLLEEAKNEKSEQINEKSE